MTRKTGLAAVRIISFSLYAVLLLLLQRTVLFSIGPFHASFDCLLGPLVFLSYSRGEHAGGLFAVCIGALVGLSGADMLVVQPLYYLFFAVLTAVLSSRLLRRNLLSFSLLLLLMCCIDGVCRLLFHAVYWQTLAPLPLLRASLPDFLCTVAAAFLFALPARLLLGRGRGEAQETKIRTPDF